MIKKYENFITEKFKTIDYKIILKDLKYNPTTLISDFKIVKSESGKVEIKAKGYEKEKGGWIYFDDFETDKTRKVWNKQFQNGTKKIKIADENQKI
jgi:hypothetical protein